MSEYRISKAAVDDVYKIGLYTEEEWGINQRNNYLDELGAHFSLLAKDFENRHSKLRNDIREGCYFSPINKHIVVFRRFSYGIRIVRVLHQTMDFSRHV